MTDQIPARIVGGRVAHKPRNRPYAYGCNPAAIRRAARDGYDGIDLDMRTNAEGTGWCFHQANPTRRDGWEDPAGIIDDWRALVTMSDAECARLRYQGRPSMSVRDALLLCKANGIIPCFEDKTFIGQSVDYWAEVKAMADKIGVTPVIMSLPGRRSVPGTRKLEAAHAAGLVTMWLWRLGSKIPPFVDLVKSHWGRPIYRLGSPPSPRSPWRRYSIRWRRIVRRWRRRN